MSGKRYGILQTVKEEKIPNETETMEEEKVEACFIDAATGQKECA